MANPTQNQSSKAEVELFGWNGTSWRELRCDPATRALVTIPYDEYEIKKGNHFYVSGYDTLALNAVTEFYFTTATSTISLGMNFQYKCTEQTIMQIWEGATGLVVGTGGVTATIFNSKRASTNASTVEVVKNPDSYTGTGTLIFSTNIGALRQGGTFESLKTLELDGYNYIFRFVSGANSNIVSYYGGWSEHVDLNETGDMW